MSRFSQVSHSWQTCGCGAFESRNGRNLIALALRHGPVSIKLQRYTKAEFDLRDLERVISVEPLTLTLVQLATKPIAEV